jgi:hypothetical protein
MRPNEVGAFMRSGLFGPLVVAAFGIVLASGPADARDARPSEPALWEMSTGKSKVYLFGSIHMLPRDWPWRTKAIDNAIRDSNVFVFETAMTQDERNKMSLFVQDHGKLPHGQKLSRMLSPKGLKDFEKALERTPLDRQSVDAMRPWLAIGRAGRLPDPEWAAAGLCRRRRGLHARAGSVGPTQGRPSSRDERKPTRDADASDTRQRHRWLRSGSARAAEGRSGLPSSAGELDGGQPGRTGERHGQRGGDQSDEKHILLDRRNRNWLPQIEAMMVQNKTVFVTVGAAHLVGPGSVLDMLCVRGWKVQRIKTGPSKPPAACSAPEQGPTVALRSSQAAFRR